MITLYDYWMDIYRRFWLILLTTAAAAGFSWYLSASLPPLYESKTVFYLPINISVPRYTSAADSAGSIAQSPFVPATEKKQASVGIGILRSKDVFRGLAAQFGGRSPSELEKNVDIKVSREFMLEVYVRDRDPRLASEIANAFPKIFEEFQRARIREYMLAVRAAAAKGLAAIECRIATMRAGAASPVGCGEAPAADPGRGDMGSQSLDAELKGRTEDHLRLEAEKLRNRMLEASLQANEPVVPVILVETATPSERPVFPIVMLNVIVAGVTGFFAGCYYALFCGFLDRRRRTLIARELEMPSLTPDEMDRIKALGKARHE